MFGTAKAASTSTRVSPPIARKGSHQAPQKAVTLSQIEFPSVESVQRDKDTRVSQPIARHISHQAPQKAVSTLSTLSQVEFPSTDAVQNPHDLSRSTLSTEEGRTLKQKWNKAADATSTAAAKHDRVAETYFTQSHTRTSGLRSSSKKAATHRGAKNLAHDSSAQATAYSLSDNHTLGERVVAICIQGGGIKGACYSGLVEAFELHGMKLRPPGLDRHNPDDHNDVLVASDPDDPDIVRKFSGTSAGSVCAAGLALGFSAQRIASAIENMPWNDFMDGSSGFGCFNSVGDIIRLFTKFGLYKGDRMEQHIDSLFEDATGMKGVTFLQAYEFSRGVGVGVDGKQKVGSQGTLLRIPAVNLCTGMVEWFDYKSTPNMKLSFAIRMSSSIPIVYCPVRWNDMLYVDGGMVANLPNAAFDQDEKKEGEIVVCLKLTDDKILAKLENPYSELALSDAPDQECCSSVCLPCMTHCCCFPCVDGGCLQNQMLVQYANMLVDTLFEHAQDAAKDVHTINIYTGNYTATEFSIDRLEIESLVDFGRKAGHGYFAALSKWTSRDWLVSQLHI